MNTDMPKADFCIEIEYKKGSGNPSRVFRSMSELIDSFQEIDKTLVGSVDVNIQPILLNESLRKGDF